MASTTLLELFEESVQQYPEHPLLWEKRDNSFESTTYGQTRSRVRAFAGGFLALGVRAGDRVALISEGRNDWVVGELGILLTGAINVPLSVKLQAEPELRFRLAHAGCCAAVVSASQLPKVRLLRKDLPLLKIVVLLDPVELQEEGEIGLAAFLAKGEELLRESPETLDARRALVLPDDPATICYTSGTTADPKGVVLTHRNYLANVEQSSSMFSIPPSYTSLLILPWDHCFAHTAGIYTLMRNGASMASVQTGKTPMETLKNIPLNIRETRPSFLLSVPTLARNFRKNIEAGVHGKGRLAELLFRAGLGVANACNGNGDNKGKGLRALLLPLLLLFDRILFSKIRENFGGRLEFFVGGGALLDVELQRFFCALGIPMLQGYGLTEASPVISANKLTRYKFGSSGLVVPNLDVRICDEQGRPLPPGVQGEIVVKGENVMAGYWKNERATREMIRDGWLYTGDLGRLDADGFLFVVGRTKSLLIANDGEKYSPEGIEETICSQSRCIDQLMLYNNQSPFTVALVVPKKEALLSWMKSHGHAPDDENGQCAALRLLAAEIDAYRPGGHSAGLFPDRWLPSALAVLPEGFTEQNGLLNSTLKIVRGRIAECHAGRLAHLYTPEGKDPCNLLNRKALADMLRPV